VNHPTTPTDPLTIWAQVEARLSTGRYHGQDSPGTVGWFPGHRPILLTAPHAVAHDRDGARKAADVGTGGLAVTAAQLTGASALIATGYQHADGNHVGHGPFKTAAAVAFQRAGTVLDLHGMGDHHGVDICLGTGATPPGRNELLEAAHQVFTSAGFTVTIDTPFAAPGEHTVTSTAQRAGLAGLQVEISGWLRRPWASTEACGAVLAALVELVHNLPDH
jgi:phage replication-related protein YjqB (UPF0714/DUF867 family)